MLMPNNYCWHKTTKNTAITNEIWIVIVLVLTVENLGRLWGEKKTLAITSRKYRATVGAQKDTGNDNNLCL